MDDRIWVRLPLDPWTLENCHDSVAVGAPYCFIFVSRKELRPSIVQSVGRRGGREWQTRSSTCEGMLTSGNAKPGEEREEGEEDVDMGSSCSITVLTT